MRAIGHFWSCYNDDVRHMPHTGFKIETAKLNTSFAQILALKMWAFHHSFPKGEAMRASRSTSPLAGRLLSCREAAQILGVSDETVRRLIHSGKLEAVRIGQRILRVFGESLESCMQTQTVAHRLGVTGEATCSVSSENFQPAVPSNETAGGTSQSEGGVA